VDAARQGGDTAALQSALDALIRGADDAVAQEAAWELARLDLQRGRRDLALVSIARGLGRPGGHPLAQSRLLALQGEVLEQRGDAAGAKESYRRAVRVR
jgi:predicted negative regulator of RcsB-dependent stress response